MIVQIQTLQHNPTGIVDLQHDIMAELTWDPVVRGRVISPVVVDGIVTLTGTVWSEAERRAAEDATRRVHGVKGVVNCIEVFVPEASLPDDEELARTISLCLQAQALLPPEAFNVDAHGGWVTVTGNVAWHFQREEVERLVSRVRGVVGVVNLIAIVPVDNPENIQPCIEAALQRCAGLDAQWITVETYRGKVVLRGSVRSWQEWDQAEAISWRAPGVLEVINHLSVTP